MAPTDRFVSETTFRVRYAETDAMGIVHHASYVVYFEEGRSSYARQRGHAYSEVEKAGYYLTVTEVNARYLVPARYDQAVTVKTWLAEMKSRGLTFAYEIVDAGNNKTLVTGSSKHICITHEGKVTHVPEEWRAWANPLPE